MIVKPRSMIQATALIVAIGIALTACAPHETGKGTTVQNPDESIALMYATYEATLKSTHQTGWESRPRHADSLGIIPDSCLLSDGEDGMQYSDWLFGPPSQTSETDAEKVASYWRSRGLDVKVEPPVTASDDEWNVRGVSPDISIVYSSSPRTRTMSFVMPCIRGNSDEWALKVIAEREKRSPTGGASAFPTDAPSPEP
ncbi:hypothetical protein [Frondihabitans australicus]|uniref:Lipoprotein n=1 Tax=Frondihabitans australicus TaxID=386892 RepID=A0A495IBU7_9MICO|nr:hypothetical protein [Frondihabitans australicus]RKR73474.1 hypothetical protein C8E83_0567 [Frondihabitans australicus]